MVVSRYTIQTIVRRLKTLYIYCLLIVWPSIFIFWSWIVSGGMPLFITSNETYLSFNAGMNMYIYNPWSFSFLTDESTDPTGSTPRRIYTHNPNLPRYPHYALILLGFHTLSSHVIILSLVLTWIIFLIILHVFYGSFRHYQHDWFIVPLALIVDYVGFLAFMSNSYRIWTFILFWACIAAVVRRWPLWAVSVTGFLLFQYEYGFALFMATTLTCLAVQLGWRAHVTRLVAGIAGAVSSLAVFGIQVVSYLGIEGAIQELVRTYVVRGRTQDLATGSSLPLTLIQRGFLGVTYDAIAAVGDLYNQPVLWLLGWALASSCVRIVVSRDGVGAFLARLLTSMVAGVFVLAMFLQSYYLQAFNDWALPFFVLFVGLAIGVCALDLATLAQRLGRDSAALRGSIAALLLLPILVNSVQKFHLPFSGEAIRILSEEYRGEPTLSPRGNVTTLIFALTGAHAFFWEPGSSEIPNLDSLRGSDGRMYFVCLDLVETKRAVFTGPQVNNCPGIIEPLLLDGHDVIRQGDGYVIVAMVPKAR